MSDRLITEEEIDDNYKPTVCPVCQDSVAGTIVRFMCTENHTHLEHLECLQARRDNQIKMALDPTGAAPKTFLPCLTCQKEYKSAKIDAFFRDYIHDELLLDEINPKDVHYQCKKCDRSVTKEAMKTHPSKCPKMLIKCDKCKDSVTLDHPCSKETITCHNGCEETFIREDEDLHNMLCIHIKVECKQCDYSIKKKDHVNHSRNECKMRKVECSKCKEFVIFESMKDHPQICNANTTNCTKCDIKFQQFKLEDHMKTCEMNTEDCTKCKIQIQKFKLENHMLECKMNVVECSFDNCKEMIQVSKYDDHQMECKWKEIPCRYSHLGCTIKMTGIDLEKHEEDSKDLHLSLARDIKVMPDRISINDLRVDPSTFDPTRFPFYIIDQRDPPNLREIDGSLRSHMSDIQFTDDVISVRYPNYPDSKEEIDEDALYNRTFFNIELQQFSRDPTAPLLTMDVNPEIACPTKLPPLNNAVAPRMANVSSQAASQLLNMLAGGYGGTWNH